MRQKQLKILVTLVAIAAIVARLFFPSFKIDTVTLCLILLALVPWLIPLIKSAEFPGGWKVEFRDIKDAVKTAATISESKEAPVEAKDAVGLLDEDSNLHLVNLRIEIEKRVRVLAGMHGLGIGSPLLALLEQLSRKKVLEDTMVSGIRDLIIAGNKAAHGAQVEPAVAKWAYENSDRFIYFLTQKLNDQSKA